MLQKNRYLSPFYRIAIVCRSKIEFECEEMDEEQGEEESEEEEEKRGKRRSLVE